MIDKYSQIVTHYIVLQAVKSAKTESLGIRIKYRFREVYVLKDITVWRFFCGNHAFFFSYRQVPSVTNRSFNINRFHRFYKTVPCRSYVTITPPSSPPKNGISGSAPVPNLSYTVTKNETHSMT